ncbi:hypothetical protein ACW9HC_01905 [Nocardia gipuzkoensis]
MSDVPPGRWSIDGLYDPGPAAEGKACESCGRIGSRRRCRPAGGAGSVLGPETAISDAGGLPADGHGRSPT